MTLLASFARTTFPIAAAIALASACGGQSFQGHGGEAGDAGTGGTKNLSGSSSIAGKTHGGTTSGGSSSGGSASGGTSFDEACAGPADLGSCAAAFPRWSHDAATGLCRPIIYGGCGATKNNYETLEACQQACPGRSPNFDACKMATDCILGSTGCCGVCDGPDISAHDFVAYNKAYAAELPQCDVACGACPPLQPGLGTMQYFLPNCLRGECVVEDIRTSDATACATAEDCRLRHGTGCCEGCSNDDLVAVRNDGSFDKQVCGDFIPPCDPCAPPPTNGAVALCEAGHCQVGYLLDGR
jgi:hypothetical protein